MTLGHKQVWLVGVFALLLMPMAFIYAGYYLGKDRALSDPSALHSQWRNVIEEQQEKLKESSRVAQENMNALAQRLGLMQAHVIRLDALGQRLTRMAKLDKGEFNFESLPAQGGPVDNSALEQISVPDFLSSLEELSVQLEDRSKQLAVLETMIMSRNLQAEVLPTGRPVERGWMSSFFGMRTDPFTGRREHHKGVDFAGKAGSDVIAVAAGVVTWAGKRYGYGELVEVNHGNGYSTRYGHNDKVLVKVGQAVKKSQRLALMGSTGRSTGPHVHFEVLLNGKTVNPERYVLRGH